MEKKMFINELQNYSDNLMNVVNIISSEEVLGQNGHTPCDIFNWIRGILVGYPWPPTWSPVTEDQLTEMGISLGGGSSGILEHICEALEDAIEDVSNNKLKKQLIRALKLCRCLVQILRTINCIDGAQRLVGRLFCLLLEIILAVVAIIVKILVLLNVCDEEYTCGKVRASFCDCLICALEKELDSVQKLIEELRELAISFIKFATKDCESKDDKCHDDWKDKDKCKCHDDWKCEDDWKWEDDWKKQNVCKRKKDSGCKC